MKFFLTAALCFCFAFAFAGAAQTTAVQQPAKPGSLSGTLNKSGGGDPIRNAEISVTRSTENSQRLMVGEDETSPDSQQITVLTDANGHFQFPSLAPGEYMLSVRKNGFHGFRGPNSQSWQEAMSITVSSGQAINDLALSMQPGAVIIGKVLDEDGEPMAYVQVNAMKWVYANHRRQLRPIGMATTDDQGNYRLFSLEPGRYVVRANVVADNGPAKVRYAPSYFPDTTSPTEANPIVLRPGDQASADFRMTRTRAARISGRVAGTVPGGQTQVYLRNVQDEGLSVSRGASASVDTSGRFTLDGVLPGEYVLGALEFRGDNNDNPEHAEIPLRVDSADLNNVNLTLEDAGKATLQGTLRVDGSNSTHPRLDSLRVGFLPADDSTANSEYVGAGGYSSVGPNGSVRLDKISPGRYVVSLTADGNGWEDFYTKSVQIGNRDVTDSVVAFSASRGVVPIAITIGIDGAYVDGTVTDESNKPVANATVIGVPEPSLRSQFDLYQRGETDQNGHFQLRGIKPGAYSFYAWGNLDDESYMDPDFLRRFENARTDVTLNPKDRQTIQLKLLSADE